MSGKKTTISLVKSSGTVSNTFADILSAINNYLLRNKGAISDFNLIKDIVDRNIENQEDAISSNLPIPLYLGLMGTMLGIILGLIGMPSLSESAGDNSTMIGVDALLAGVKIAMIASVIGLLLTTINSFLFYHIRQKTEKEKNKFFTFIQTHLLPILSRNTASSLQTLQANLLKFNDGFSTNMSHFDGVIKEVRRSFESQLQVVEELKRIDVSNMAKYNIRVMKQIEGSFSKLKDLAEYLTNVNGLLKNTQQLNFTVSGQLDKVGQIASIVENFDTNAKNIVDGSRYLQTHFADFEQREQMLSNKMADFDSSTGEMVVSLKKSFEERLKQFNESDVKINSSFEETFNKINSGFEKLFNDLREKTSQVFDDESQNISAIQKDVVKYGDAVSQIRSIPSEVMDLKNKVKEQDTTINLMLEKIANKPIQFRLPKIVMYSLIIVSVVVIATCGLFIYKYLI